VLLSELRSKYYCYLRINPQYISVTRSEQVSAILMWQIIISSSSIRPIVLKRNRKDKYECRVIGGSGDS
jgi:hypothetical protein